MSDYIEVIGHGHVDEPPDILAAQLGAEARAPDIATALEATERAMQAMTASARETGVGSADIRTTGMTVHPDHDHQGRPSGYVTSIGLGLVLRDVGRAGEVVAAVVAAGGEASRVGGVALGLDDPEPARAAARDRAFENARRKAEQLAALSGRELGTVLRVRDHRTGHVGGFEEQSGVAMASMTALTIEPGTGAVRATVIVRWQLI